jgi:hypothetical protein
VACRNALDPWVRDAVRTAGLADYDGMLRRRSVTIEDAEKAAAL